MELIDRFALLRQIEKFRYYFGRPARAEEILWGIEDAPAVEIINCEDCRYSRACYSDDGEDLYECCKVVLSGKAITTSIHPSGWFCADGKMDCEEDTSHNA